MANGKANETVEKVERVLLSEIDFDYKWNCRSDIEAGSGGPEGGDGSDDGKGGFAGLVESIKQRGQDEPIIVRPHPDSKNKKAYKAVTGHRRGMAVARIAEQTGNKAPTINAIVRSYNEEQARELNISENTARDDLSGPDLAFGVAAMSASNPILNATDIAKRLGLGQSYVSKLLAITGNVNKKLLQDWRETPKKLTTEQMMSVAKVDKAEQEVKYNEIKAKKGGDQKRGPGAWVENTKTAFKKWGTVFGELVRMGQMSFANVEAFFDVTTDAEGGITRFVTVKKEATDAQRSKFTDAAMKAYEAAYEGETEVKPKKNGRVKEVVAAS